MQVIIHGGGASAFRPQVTAEAAYAEEGEDPYDFDIDFPEPAAAETEEVAPKMVVHDWEPHMNEYLIYVAIVTRSEPL